MKINAFIHHSYIYVHVVRDMCIYIYVCISDMFIPRADSKKNTSDSTILRIEFHLSTSLDGYVCLIYVSIHIVYIYICTLEVKDY